MEESAKPESIIWAKWRVGEDGRVEVEATYAEAGEYRQWRVSFASVAEAGAELGPNFQDVVERALEINSYRGRWRP